MKFPRVKSTCGGDTVMIKTLYEKTKKKKRGFWNKKSEYNKIDDKSRTVRKSKEKVEMTKNPRKIGSGTRLLSPLVVVAVALIIAIVRLGAILETFHEKVLEIIVHIFIFIVILLSVLIARART